jgi:VWFA-related protein
VSLRAIAAVLIVFSTSLAARPGDRLTSVGQTFTSRVEAVRVDVLVSDDGEPVRGLKAGDFEVRDNGVLQQIDLVSFEEVPLAIAFALDLSDSVTEDGLQHLKDAASAVLDGLKPGDRAGLLTFSHIVAQRSVLSQDFRTLRAELDRVQPIGDTALVDACQAALALASTPSARTLVIVFSDGLDTSSWLTPDLVLGTARRSEPVVYGVTLGRRLADDFLEQLTDVTGGRLLPLQSTDRLRATFLQILEEFRHRYLVSYTPRGVSRDGWHRLQVRIKGRRASVRARAGYFAGL